MATRQVGDETLSPRAYDLVRSAHPEVNALCHQSLRTRLGAVR